MQRRRHEFSEVPDWFARSPLAEKDELKLFAFSDLHLGAYYSRGREYAEFLGEQFGQADIVWMLGDIFETKATGASLQDIVLHATRVIREWCATHPETTFVWISGNHEVYKGRNLQEIQTLIQAMRTLGEDIPNFHVPDNHHYVKLGGLLGVHGDTTSKYQALERPYLPGAAETANHPIHKLLDLTKPFGQLNATLHTVGNIAAPGLIARTVMHPLKQHMEHTATTVKRHNPDWRHELTDIVDGHIHFPYSGELREGILHHNSGCTPVGRTGQFRPVIFTLDGDLNVTGRRQLNPDAGVHPLARLVDDLSLIRTGISEATRISHRSRELMTA